MSGERVEAAVVYDLRLKEPGSRMLEVACRIGEPDPDGQVVSLPGWIPGSYLIRDFARHVVRLDASSDDVPVQLHKIDKATWRAAPVSGPLVIRADIYAGDTSVRGAWFDASRAFVNGVCVFLKVHGREAQRCVVHVSPPDHDGAGDWQVVTAMSRLTGADRQFGAFEAAGYDELIDHPILAGDCRIIEFEVDGVPHELAISGRAEADFERLRDDAAQLCQAHAAFFGGLPPMRRYSFLLMILERGYGGLEHRASAALVCGRDDLPRGDPSKVSTDYRKLLGLVSHEYFHLWNVKRIRPRAFVDADLAQEAYTRQLWVFEGITSYYDDLMLLRSGLITAESYLDLLGRTLTTVYRSRGRRHQSLEDASFDAWIKFYRPDENSPNATVSYYTKGAMVALALDLELRVRTSGGCSLDDVMSAFWKEYGRAESAGVPEGGFERLAAQVSGLDLDDFFRQCLRRTVDPPVGILLAQVGVRLHLRAQEGESDPGGLPGKREDRPRPWLGVALTGEGGQVTVRFAFSDGPGQVAGLAAGDEIVAIDGYRVTPKSVESCLDNVRIDRPTRVHVFRSGELLAFDVAAVRPPRDTCYLQLEGAADGASLERRREWLGV